MTGWVARAGAAIMAAALVVTAGPAAEARPALPAPPAVGWPGADYDPAIPTIAAVLGHAPGLGMARHEEARRYVDALAAAAPDRVRVGEYGRTWEGRRMFYAVVGAPQTLARLDEIKAGMAKLADPRRLAPGEGERLIARLPAVVWLGYSVHGNEPSTTDAALMTAYHLLAARGDPRLSRMMQETLVILTPNQNPDGRERFINATTAARGLEADPSSLSAERDEPWPGGRMNHYVFDLNRDWFSQTQPEQRANAALMLSYMPVVVADFHEMGTDQTFFFPPNARPKNPQFTDAQEANVALVGRTTARWFDRFGQRYFSREIFDGFFPGYGSGWPKFQGINSLLYEQGSARGLVARRSDGHILHYAETVQNQFVAGLATVETAAENRERFLRDFLAFRASAIEEGRREPVKAYVLSAAPDPDLAARLAVMLARNGVEVTRATAAFAACGATFPAGSMVVSAAQPTKRLIRTLLDPQVDMGADFVREQADRVRRGLPDEIYDVTAWSVPLAYNVPVTACAAPVAAAGETVGPDWRLPGGLTNPDAGVAFLVPWGSTASARFLSAALRAGVAVRSANRAFTTGGVRYPAGSLMIPVAGQADLARRLAAIAADTGATVTGVSDGWVTDGPSFGSINMLHMPTPRVALIWDEPTERYSAGHARFVLERELGYPVTLIRGQRLAASNLDGFDVIVVPGEGRGYAAMFGRPGADLLRGWVTRGGVLIGLGTGVRYLASKEVDLLPIRLEEAAGAKADAKPAEAADARAPGTTLADDTALAQATRAQNAAPLQVAGVLARAAVTPDHWLSAGVPPNVVALVNGSDIYTPPRQNQADLVARFEGPDRVLASGVLWEESRTQLAYKPFVVSRRLGRGLVVGFTADPNYRAHMPGLNLLFANAVFRGAAVTHDANVGAAGEVDDAR